MRTSLEIRFHCQNKYTYLLFVSLLFRVQLMLFVMQHLLPMYLYTLMNVIQYLSTEWVDYVEEPMKYQALRPHFFSMGGWGVVGWGWWWVGLGWWWGG